MKITKKKFKVLSDEKIIKGAYTQYLHLTLKTTLQSACIAISTH